MSQIHPSAPQTQLSCVLSQLKILTSMNLVMDMSRENRIKVLMGYRIKLPRRYKSKVYKELVEF